MSERSHWTENDLNVDDLHRIWAEKERRYRREKTLTFIAWVVAMFAVAVGSLAIYWVHK